MIILWNKQKGTGGSGGGGSAKLPTIVTDSGSSLPVDLTGYNEGDTFLNTSDKKIYTASAGMYELNTGVSINNTYNPDQKVNIDYTTGYASGFYYIAGNNPPTTLVSKTISNSNSGFQWTGNKEIKIHFKVFDSFVSNKNYGLFTTTKNGYSIYIILKSDGLYFSKVKSYTSTYDIDETKQLLSCSWEIDKEYYLKINKNEGTTTVTLSNIGYDQDIILSNTLEITDYTGSLTTNQATGIGNINERYGNIATTTYPFGVYLLDTTNFDYLVPSGSLNWDSGTSLTDKTEYADKTNGALYLYENSELVKVPQNKIFTGVYANSWVVDSTYADYGYKCELSCSGVTANMFAQVIFAPAQADSGNYATVCLTGNGTVTIYSKVNDTISIPSIVVMGV